METWNDWKEAQPQVVPMLLSSIKKNRMAHAYIFEGQAGSGKQSIAQLMAKSYFCTNKDGYEPCLTCSNCNRIESGNHPDVHVIEPEGQSIKKEQIEFLQKEFAYRSVETSAKIYVINDANKMTVSAANSLLKFLEEPQGETLALLLTEQPAQLLPTIKSRSQQLRFLPPTNERLAKQLMNDGVDKNHAYFLAELTGNKEAALQLTDADWSFQARSVVLQLMHELYTRPDQAAMTLVDKWIPLMGNRLQQETGLEMIVLWLRDLLYTQVGKQGNLIFSDCQKQFDEIALLTSQRVISQSLANVLEAKRQLSANVSIQLVMERLLFTIQEG
ncbi:DNA polymerase III delta prime subunit [Bacillus sp. JCM 19046]|nr:DNA polymerase III delta prime subunit [Bacillus sp. JCM 19045]GAF17750.1 DNA polymerase III delta prime subunit [Bacillus sp. JCM 19046]